MSHNAYREGRCVTSTLYFTQRWQGRSNLVPRGISAFKMAGGREDDPGEKQVTCLQKYWRF